MKKGDRIQVRFPGRTWLDAEVMLVTRDDRPGMVAVDEGVPLPFALLDGKQILCLTWHGDHYDELHGGRIVEVR